MDKLKLTPELVKKHIDAYVENNTTMYEFDYAVTLCGSTRFKNDFMQVNLWLTLMGCSVYSVSSFPQVEAMEFTPEQKDVLDCVHKRKIFCSHAIFVIDVDGYIGESTKSEIAHADAVGSKVFYLSNHLEEYRQWLIEIAKQSKPTLTEATLERIGADGIFGVGSTVIDGKEVTWIAKRGYAVDWAIYYEETSLVATFLIGQHTYLARYGNKVKNLPKIKELVPNGDEDFYNAYRF